MRRRETNRSRVETDDSIPSTSCIERNELNMRREGHYIRCRISSDCRNRSKISMRMKSKRRRQLYICVVPFNIQTIITPAITCKCKSFSVTATLYTLPVLQMERLMLREVNHRHLSTQWQSQHPKP